MKKFLAILVVVAQAVVLHGEPAEPAQPLTAAVLDFQVSGKDFEKMGAEAAVLLNARLSAASNLILVERQELDKALGEQELGLSGNVTPETAAKVGQLVGAKVLITGRLFKAENKYFAVAKIIGTETSRVFGETATFTSPETFDGAINELAPKIAAVIDKQGATLTAKAEDPAAHLDRLKKIVEGKKLPSVSVKIGEQHIGRPVADPAAQTEMENVLQKLGFEVVDSASGKSADTSITGDAFSEMAGRRGNLVSCRSRVEIKVLSNGKLLLADRQTDVAVDLAEHVAGKTALQEAAWKLLDRVVPALAGVNP